MMRYGEREPSQSGSAQSARIGTESTYGCTDTRAGGKSANTQSVHYDPWYERWYPALEEGALGKSPANSTISRRALSHLCRLTINASMPNDLRGCLIRYLCYLKGAWSGLRSFVDSHQDMQLSIIIDQKITSRRVIPSQMTRAIF